MQNETSTSTVLLNGEQAKSELAELEVRAKGLRKSIRDAADVGDLAGIKRYNKELKDVNANMKTVKSEAFNAKKVLDDISGSSLKELTAAQRKIDSLLRNGNVKRHSDEWKELAASQKIVKGEIAKVNAEMSIGTTGAEKFSGGFRQMIMGAVAGIAALTGVYMALKKFMQLRMELEDSQANLKALTGLGDDDMQWLTDYAKKLSTTTTEAGIRITASSKEIMDGFTVIGSKRPELLKNKEAMAEVTKAALILAAAGKMDVKEAFEAVTASMNQFNLGADQSNRIINVLGAGALEGSAEINDLSGSMKNVGTVAANSNMTLEQTIAALEVLASKQLLGEEAGTKLRGALLKMKEAGVGYVSGAFVMRDAIVEINSKLKNKTGALERDAYMQKVFGIENITAGMILLDNVDSYDKLTKAITNTTVAEKQAAINTATTSAKLAQAKNNYNEAGMALVKNLEPAMLAITNAGVAMIRIFVKYPALAIGLVSAIGLLTVAYVANTVAMMANVLWTKLVAEATTIANSKTVAFFKTIITNPYVAMGVAIAAVTVFFYKMATAQTDAEKAHKKLNESFRTAEDSIASERVQIDILFNRLKIAKKGTEEYQTTKDAIITKYGQYLKGLGDEKTALDNVALAYKTITDEAVKSAKARALADATKVASDDLAKTQGELKEKTKKLLDDKYGKDSYNSMRIYAQIEPVIDKGMGSEKLNKEYAKLFNKSNTLYNGPGSVMTTYVTNELETLLNLGKRAKNIFDDVNKSAELKFGAKQKVGAVKPTGNGDNVNVPPVAPSDNSDHKVELAEVDKWIAEEQIKFKKRHLNNLDSEEIYQKNLVNITKEALEWKMSIYKKGSKEYLDYKDQVLSVDLKLQDDAEKTSIKAMKELQDERLNAMVLYDNQERELLNQDLEDGLISQKEYENKILAHDKVMGDLRVDTAKENAREIKNFKYKSDEEKLAATLAANKAIEEAEKGLTDAQKKIYRQSLADKKEIAKEIEEIEKKYGIGTYKDKRKEFNDDLKRLKELHDIEMADIKKTNAEKLKTEKDYQAAVSKIKLAKAEQLAQDISDVMNAAANLSASLQEAETMAVDNKYAKQLDAAKKAGQDTTALEAQIEEEKKAIKKKYADLDFAITAGKIIAETALQIIKAGANIPLAILMGLLGASQLAVAVQQRSATQNLWTGGFTEPGDKYKPAGIVHAGEFVGNQDAVRSTPMRKVFNLIDYAQRTNTVARITNEDIARVVGIRQGFSGSGSTPGTSIPGANSESVISKQDLAVMYGVIAQNNRIIKSLNDQLEKGITANYKISGNDGVVKGIEDYNKLIKNAKG